MKKDCGVRGIIVSCILAVLLFIWGCGEKTVADSGITQKTMMAAQADEIAAVSEKAAQIAGALDDRQLAAQVIISGIDGRGRLTGAMRSLLEEYPVGGVMLFRYNLDTNNESIRELIAECNAVIANGSTAALSSLDETAADTVNGAAVTVLPFAAVDHEGGTVNRFLPGAADLPAAASYLETAQNSGKNSAAVRIAADAFHAGTAINVLGVNFNFAPVAEYLNGNNRVFLKDRAYSFDPDFTAEAAAAFITGMNQAGILCAVKHFPGSAGEDPHRFPSVIHGGSDELAKLAAPFAALIRGGQARAIMVSHTSVPARDSERIASLSPAVMGGWLRDELGFTGIIITDDFAMAAAGGQSENGRVSAEVLAVQSLAAGADMVMAWPPELAKTHRAIRQALGSGELSRERLRDAVKRIIIEKINMGLIDDK